MVHSPEIAQVTLYPSFGSLLNPFIGAIAMSLSVPVISNALRLRRTSTQA
jgi:cation transport ATPase